MLERYFFCFHLSGSNSRYLMVFLVVSTAATILHDYAAFALYHADDKKKNTLHTSRSSYGGHYLSVLFLIRNKLS